mmetsp:Transcript_21684/g.24203  ORF Transcript_21684/g.24203 Transcript_21684/m.24203 type:complete len:433 (-) Transcript_21684:86-1384(-)
MEQPGDSGDEFDIAGTHAKRCSLSNVFSLDFSNKEDKVVVPHTDDLTVSSELTLETWVYMHKLCTGYLIVKKSSFALAIKKTAILVAVKNIRPGWVWKNSRQCVPIERWAHIACTYSQSKSNLSFYLNGVRVKSISSMHGPIDCTKNDLHFGLHLVSEYLSASMSDVRIWNRALKEEDIKKYMYEKPPIDAEGLLGWWPMKNGFGVDIEDITKNDFTGTLKNALWIRAPGTSVAQNASTLQSDMKGMFNNEMCSDLVLKASDSDEKIFVYRGILSIRSTYFKAMLSGGMKEQGQSEICIPDIRFAVLSKMLEFIYTGTVKLTGDTVLELFVAADRFDLQRLKYLCEAFMLENIDKDTVCTMLESADKLHSKLLKGRCIWWILQNYGEMLESEEFNVTLSGHLRSAVNAAAAKEYFPKSKRRKLTEGGGYAAV